MSATKEKVMIKGNKNGLIFIFDDQCPFEELVAELRYKLEKSHQQFLMGPLVHVQLKLGKRTITSEEKHQLQQLVSSHGNLIVKNIQARLADEDEDTSSIVVVTGMVRSGQTVEHKRSIMLLGDVNPGGMVKSDGNIFVMGALRGIAHAGAAGNTEAVIASSYLSPTQLKIADVISRPPDEWDIRGSAMEFAYLADRVMKIDKIPQLHKIRPEICDL